MNLLIHGYPHSGTTLLRKIIGSVESIYEVPNEGHIITDDIISKANGKHIAIKFPFSYTSFYTPEYDNFIKIFIIRNPYYIYSSMNKRFNNNIPENHSIERCIKMLSNFIYYRDIEKVKRAFFIKYEELFDNNFYVIRKIFEMLKVPYTNDIFINKNVKEYTEIPSECGFINEPYRQWQLQQPYEYKDIERPVYLTKQQLEILDNSSIVKKIGYTRPATVHIIE